MNDVTETTPPDVALCPPGGEVANPASEKATIVVAVTAIMGTVVGLTFLFGFGNVLTLALRLDVPMWVAPLVAPAVDLSILGLLLGTRHLALTGASAKILRPARRLLIFASLVTLALNVADPLVAGEYGKAAFDAVGPLLLIGWSEVGPGLLQAISATNSTASEQARHATVQLTATSNDSGRQEVSQLDERGGERQNVRQMMGRRSLDVLLEQARREDAAHRAAHQRPISADVLRGRLGVGAVQARRFVKIVRAEFAAQAGAHSDKEVVVQDDTNTITSPIGV